MKVSFKLLDVNACVPSRKNRWDAGLDLFCLTSCEIEPGEQSIIKTGVALAGMPINYFLQIWPKSGLDSKQGAHTGAGIIDSGHRDEILVLLKNTGKNTIRFNAGDAVAQMVILRGVFPEIEVVESDLELGRNTDNNINKVLGDNNEI